VIRHFLNDDVLSVHVYGREGLEQARTAIPAMLADQQSVIREVVVKVHFARPEDVNGGDKLMSCMFAHSLTRLIAIVPRDEGQIEYLNRESGMFSRHGIQARAFRSIADLADWIERELPRDVLVCAM